MSKVQLPFGMQDYLPDDCYNKELTERALSSVFSSYGYKKVCVPTLEYYDLFTADDSISGKKLFKLTDTDGALLALRADPTLQVCRMYVTNMNGVQRMYYALDSFEYLSDSNSSRDREFAQMGAELLGETDVDGEVELLTMAIDSFLSAGLKDFKIEIGHVGFFEGIAEEAGLTSSQISELKTLITKKDMIGVELFFKDVNASENIKKSLLGTPSLFGDVSVLEKASKLCNNEKSKEALKHLRYILNKTNKMGLSEYVSVDLGLVSCNNYYTGIVFKGFCEGVGASILDGGRYDKLCDRMGNPTKAVGFAIGIKRLMKALKYRGVWEKAPIADIAYAVIDCDERIIRKNLVALRKRNRVVRVYGDETALIEYCKNKNIKKAIIFDGDAVELNLNCGGKR
ncbi:MAG: ATP phosphoribosyltransferase regulatory subunit [Clostridia bacterium]|nr:ATP phosphoribosyltransferase regulatory subunit [Clostridia bacterium]